MCLRFGDGSSSADASSRNLTPSKRSSTRSFLTFFCSNVYTLEWLICLIKLLQPTALSSGDLSKCSSTRSSLYIFSEMLKIPHRGHTINRIN
jgi:hypothetical protein